jgi:L-ascorbate metabolism protein UlaG (beta-lactamase superfamily)
MSMRTFAALVAILAMISVADALAQNVKVTFLGSHAGELCNRDRATIFEDPTGVRILYDAGQTVTGGDDARLGNIHVVLVTHAHGDHIGDAKLKALEAGTCDRPEQVPDFNTTTGEIAAAKNSAIIMLIPLGGFIGKKVEGIRGKPTGDCPLTGGNIVVPQSAPCIATMHTGGTRAVRTADATKAVEIITVPAIHDSALPLALMSEALRKQLEADNIALQLGPASGYVIRFTNGLVAYLSGDTAVNAEMKSVVADLHKPNLMMLNLGQNSITPKEAAFVANEIVRPASVIATHVNEVGTVGGKVRPGSRTEQYMSLVKGRPVYLAISGKTMEFDGEGKCAMGC